MKQGEKVLDLGTGTGIIPILLAGKTKAGHLTGLEIQEESADMARRSVLYNHLEDREMCIRDRCSICSLRSFVSFFRWVSRIRALPRRLP